MGKERMICIGKVFIGAALLSLLSLTLAQTAELKKLQTPFILQKGQKVEKAILNIVINGKGTIWIDDIHLLKKSFDKTTSDITKKEDKKEGVVK